MAKGDVGGFICHAHLKPWKVPILIVSYCSRYQKAAYKWWRVNGIYCAADFISKRRRKRKTNKKNKKEKEKNIGNKQLCARCWFKTFHFRKVQFVEIRADRAGDGSVGKEKKQDGERVCASAFRAHKATRLASCQSKIVSYSARWSKDSLVKHHRPPRENLLLCSFNMQCR